MLRPSIEASPPQLRASQLRTSHLRGWYQRISNSRILISRGLSVEDPSNEPQKPQMIMVHKLRCHVHFCCFLGRKSIVRRPSSVSEAAPSSPEAQLASTRWAQAKPRGVYVLVTLQDCGTTTHYPFSRKLNTVLPYSHCTIYT